MTGAWMPASVERDFRATLAEIVTHAGRAIAALDIEDPCGIAESAESVRDLAATLAYDAWSWCGVDDEVEQS